jgi:hypothetical protein
MRTEKQPGVLLLYRRRRAEWQIVGIGPITALLELRRDGDKILPAGRTPPGYVDPIPA